MKPAFKFSAATCLHLTHPHAPPTGFHNAFGYIGYSKSMFQAGIMSP